jgi:hypothetical protein
MIKCVRLGEILWTEAAHQLLNHDDVATALRRHLAGQWGNAPAEVQAENDKGTDEDHPDQVVGWHSDRNGREFLVHTRADRTATTIMLPLEY